MFTRLPCRRPRAASAQQIELSAVTPAVVGDPLWLRGDSGPADAAAAAAESASADADGTSMCPGFEPAALAAFFLSFSPSFATVRQSDSSLFTM
jgi:hypothetical protein